MHFKITITISWLLLIPIQTKTQNWSTFGGGNHRTGFSKITGPKSFSNLIWSVNSSNQTTLGNAVYSFGDHFVTSRITFSPYRGVIECRGLSDGQLKWTSPLITFSSILYCIGFTEDAVYVNDYSNGDIYALYPSNGLIKWKAKITSTTFGAYPGCVFACNGDPILAGKSEESRFTVRLDKNTGELIWSNNTVIAITPNAAMAATSDKVYRITGGITIPIVLTAIDIHTGKNLYSSSPLLGDGDQENPLTLGKDGVIYFLRDGGKLYAMQDNGNGFSEKWTFIPQSINGAALAGNISIGPDEDIYFFDTDRLVKLNHINGELVGATETLSFSQPSVSIGGDSSVYVNDGKGQFYIYSLDLQEQKSKLTAPGNVYCNPSLNKEGIFIITQAGNKISAFQDIHKIPPVADFRASKLQIRVGEPVDFFDQSSYQANNWYWTFSGADNAISNDQNPMQVKYNEVGIYPVSLRVTNDFGMDSITKECLIEVLPATQVNNQITEKLWRIFPNPVDHQISVYNVDNYLGQTIIISDLHGIIFSRSVINQNPWKFNIGFLPNGIYLISTYGMKPVRFFKTTE